MCVPPPATRVTRYAFSPNSNNPRPTAHMQHTTHVVCSELAQTCQRLKRHGSQRVGQTFENSSAPPPTEDVLRTYSRK